jgi:outer membrane immunogenic protein
MNRFIPGAIALVTIAVGAPAFAADVAVKVPPPFSWAGVYIGAGIGGVWAKDPITDLDSLNPPLTQTYSLKDAGIIGGGVVGYNFQYFQFVYGIEADFGGMGLNKTVFEPNTTFTTNQLGGGFYSDVTARLGYAFDRALVYAKGGWAIYDGTASVTNTGRFGGGTVSTGSFTGGLTVGGGLEYAFAPNWSAKIEYLHFDFGGRTASLITPQFGNGSFRFSNDLTADAVTIGVNYQFAHWRWMNDWR